MIETILDELIKEAQQSPEWKAEQALRCAKKELLKAQEPVMHNSRCGTNRFSLVWTCGKCGSDLEPNNRKARYCSNCGQAVKWE